MLKKVLAATVSIILFISCFSISSVANSKSDLSYRKLVRYVVTDGSTSDGWTYGTNLEIVNSGLPIDQNVKYNNKPSLRVNVTGSSSWWESMLTVRGWCSHDFSQYEENGYIEFNIIGDKGEETFNIGLKDNNFSRIGKQEESSYLPITNYITVSPNWQKVKIPLKDFTTKNPYLDLKYITCVLISGSGNSPQKFWINELIIDSPDLEKSYPEIKVNQIGFVQKSNKYALVSGFKEELTADVGTTFHVINSDTKKITYSGKLTLVSEFDERDSGEKVLKADFTELETKGRYYIAVDAEGIENSVNFTIGNDAYDSMIVDLLRFFYFQRQGDLDAQYAGIFARNDATPGDYQASFRTNSEKTINVSKGWYDAGDLGKYVNVGSIAVSDLLWTYERFPEQFFDGQSNIPESGNGIPDILDEARWEIEWILKMQDSESGGFYPRVQGDGNTRIIHDNMGCTTDDTACAAAALAEAYIVYKNFDLEFAKTCLNAAKKAWIYLEQNPNNIVASDVYKVSDDSMDRLWASAALFRATRDEIYHNYFKKNYIYMKAYFESSYAYANIWGRMYFTAFLDYLKADNTDKQIVEWISVEYDKWLNIIVNRWNNNAWGNTLHQGNYYWGVNNQIVSIPMGAILASELLNKPTDTVKAFSVSTLSWVLGSNPLCKSFVTGQGENSISTIYSTIYSNDNIPEVPPGYMPGGPNASNARGISNFAAKCYNENDNDWVTNEHTVYMNSPLLFLTAYVQSLGMDDSTPVLGDVNSDDIVNIDDITALKKYILGNKENIIYHNSDLNSDNKINSIDLFILKKLIIEKK